MMDLTPAEQVKLRALLALTHEDIGEAVTAANVEQFGRRVSEQLLPELESLFSSVETHLCTVEARLIQLEGRVKLLERICGRLMPVAGVRS